MIEDAIVVLGGAGDMGSKVVEEIAQGLGEERELWKADAVRDLPGRLVVADLDLPAAERLAGRERRAPGREHLAIEAVRADARDQRGLSEILRGARIVVNCVGPFYRYAQGVLAAALEAGVDYVDICDDDDATIQLLALDPMARRLGVHALVGMGWTPGLSNLLAAAGVAAAKAQGAQAQVAITWVGSASDAAGQAVVEHVFHAITRPVPVFRDGAWTLEPARGGQRDVDFPEPFGRVPAYYTGHPETVTIPRYLGGVREVEVRGYIVPDELQKLADSFVKLGMLDDEQRIAGLSGLLHPFLPALATMGEGAAPALSGLRVDVAWNGGARSYTAVDTMRRLTGIPPALAALWLAGAAREAPGVFAPEAVDGTAILAHAQRRGIAVTQEG